MQHVIETINPWRHLLPADYKPVDKGIEKSIHIWRTTRTARLPARRREAEVPAFDVNHDTLVDRMRGLILTRSYAAVSPNPDARSSKSMSLPRQ